MDFIDDPRILSLVGGDQTAANQLVAIVSHILETLWKKRHPSMPAADLAQESSPRDAEALPAAPDTVAPPSPRPRRNPHWRTALLGLVGGDPRRVEELVDTVARLWQAALPQLTVPTSWRPRHRPRCNPITKHD